jgi:hypothetical protein
MPNVHRSFPRGHSNVYADEAEPWPDLPEKARVPLIGGSRPDTSKALPPLAMGREEWEEIGWRMRWLRRKKGGPSDNPTPAPK